MKKPSALIAVFALLIVLASIMVIHVSLQNQVNSLSDEVAHLQNQVGNLREQLNDASRATNASDQDLIRNSYTIWPEQGRYDARNDWSMLFDFSDANFTHVFEQVLSAMPSAGGIVSLKQGYYDGWMVINRNGVAVKGEGASTYAPVGLPDDPPTNLTGTVLRVNAAGRDGIHLLGQLNGIHVSDLGIWFDPTIENNTGNGISDDMDNNYHLSYSSFENIRVLNHDKHHYALQISNFLHLDVRDIWAWGGPLLNLYCNRDGFQAGNSNFYSMCGYIKYDLEPIDYVNGPYPIFVHKNDSLSNVWINLLHFYRIQINCPYTQTDPQFYEATLWDCRHSTFDGLDLEGSGNGFEGNKLQVGSCQKVDFIDAYLWSQNNNVYVNVASNNVGNTFEGCQICMGTVLDSCQTDRWLGCTIDGTISKDSQADFADLPGNAGFATLTRGSSELNVTAKFIGPAWAISLQSASEASPEPVADLKVKAVQYAPTNSFTVTCADGEPAGQSIDFWWSVTWRPRK